MKVSRFSVALAMLLGIVGLSRASQTFSGTVLLFDYPSATKPINTLSFTLTCALNGAVQWQESFNTDAQGNFAVTRAAMTTPGTYSFYVKGSHFLQRANNVIPVSTGGAGQMFFALRNGDVDDDNVVSVFDYIILSEAFDTVPGDALYVENADLDGDDVISVFDYIILSENFDREGEAIN